MSAQDQEAATVTCATLLKTLKMMAQETVCAKLGFLEMEQSALLAALTVLTARDHEVTVLPAIAP